MLGPPALLSELGGSPKGGQGEAGALPPSQQLEVADRTFSLFSTILLPHQMVLSPTHPQKACQLFKLLLNTKPPVSTTERCIQCTLKKGQTFKCTKVTSAPQPWRAALLPTPLLPAPRGASGVLGLPVLWRGTGLLSCMVPVSPACSPPAPGLEGGRQTRGELKGKILSLLEGGCTSPHQEGLGGSNEPYFPHQRRGWGAGAGRGCTHTQHLPLGKGDGIQLPSPQPWGN